MDRPEDEAIRSVARADAPSGPPTCHDEPVEGFGEALRRQRQAHGLRQKDLVEALDHVIARSTLANVEVGREKPSARLWAAICQYLPDWVEPLQPWFDAAHHVQGGPPFELSGPFEILEATYVYTFREHRAPEEIIQVRRVRALADGADGYGLQLRTDSGHLGLETEALWGGWIEGHSRVVHEGRNRHLTRFHFDRALRRGQVHEFATRAWVDHDEQTNRIAVQFTRLTEQVVLTLNFLGPRPAAVWTFGPHEHLADHDRTTVDPDRLVSASPNGSYVALVERPPLGAVQGITWSW